MVRAPSHHVDEWREKIAGAFESRPEYLIPILQFIQEDAGYLPPEAMLAAARHLRIPESKVYGVASFYAQFSFELKGRHVITVCRGTACHVKGSAGIESELSKTLKVPSGGTTEDLLFTLETVACVGACALAPVVVVNGDVHAQQSLDSVKQMVDERRKESEAESDPLE